MAINLLPPQYQPKPLWEWKRLIRLLLFSFIVLLIGFSGVSYYYFRVNLNEKEASLQANINNLQPVFSKIKNYEDTLAKVQKIEVLAEKIGKTKEIWSDILADLAGSLDEEIWFIQVFKEEDKVLIEGEARNFSAVGGLAVNFRKLSWFSQVDINEAEKTENELSTNPRNNLIIRENVRFKITAQLKENISSLFVTPEKEGTN